MPEYSYESANAKLNELRKYSKNGNLQPTAAAKIMPKRVEFEAAKSKGFDPDKRIKSGSNAKKDGKNPASSSKPAKVQSPKNKYSGAGDAIKYTVSHRKVDNTVVLHQSFCHRITGPMSIPNHGTTSTHFIEERVEIGLHTNSTVKSECGSLEIAERRTYFKKVVANERSIREKRSLKKPLP